MDTRAIVSELKKERDRLNRAIAALDGDVTQATADSNVDSSSAMPPARERRHMSAATRKRLSMAMKKRWAERRKKN